MNAILVFATNKLALFPITARLAEGFLPSSSLLKRSKIALNLGGNHHWGCTQISYRDLIATPLEGEYRGRKDLSAPNRKQYCMFNECFLNSVCSILVYALHILFV